MNKITKICLCGPVVAHPVSMMRAFHDFVRFEDELRFRQPYIDKIIQINGPHTVVRSLFNFHTFENLEVNHRADVCTMMLYHLIECDHLYFLPGWSNSIGCLLEMQVARAIGKCPRDHNDNPL